MVYYTLLGQIANYLQAGAAFGRAQCYYNLPVEMCVSKKLLTRHCIALCKAPKFLASFPGPPTSKDLLARGPGNEATKFPPRPPATQHRHWLLGSVLHAKVQRFWKGDLIYTCRRWEDSPIYSLLCPIVCNPSVLAICMTVTPSSNVLFPPGGKRH